MSYLTRRLAFGVLTVWILTVAAFLLLRIAPGDAVTASLARSPGEGGLASNEIEKLRDELGLNRSWLVQYGDWLTDIVLLDPGRSLTTDRPVIDEIRPRLAVTAELTLLATAFTLIAGLGGGLISARYVRSGVDTFVRANAFVALSIPSFWVALLLVVLVANWTGHFLALGYEPLFESPRANLGAMIPAALVLAIRPSAVLLRVVRNSTLEVTRTQYFLLARARGMSRSMALYRHAFRSAMLPAVTVLGAQVVFMLGGAVIIEQVFGLPGLGRLLVDAVLSRDFPVIEALVLIFGVTAVAANLLVDLVYVRLDPRVRLSR